MTDPEIVHLAVYDTLADWETGFATAHINKLSWQQQPGRYQVQTVGLTGDPVTSMGGVTITPDVTLSQLDPEDSAMLVLPGADTWGTGELEPFMAKAQEFLDAGVPVAAICGATIGLAMAGMLDDRPHTSNASQALEYAPGYGGLDHYVDEPAVTDGDLITGSGVAPVEFAREILAKLQVYTPEVLASWYKLYGQQDPAGYFELTAVEAGAAVGPE